jgi:GntR family transcriptional regulator
MSLRDDIVLDRDSAVPLYFQVENLIKKYIESGKWKGGEKIPSEQELCKMFDVSRNTVRKAISDLIEEGILYIEHGKGTFVPHKMFNHPSERLLGFSEEMKRKNVSPGAKILEKGLIDAPPFVKEILKGNKVFNLKRLRLANDKPIAIEDAYLPKEKFPGLLDDFTEKDSLYETLKLKFGVQPYYATETIEAGLPAEEEAKLLKITTSKPILRIERRTFVKSGEIIEFVKAVYRADIYRITLNLRRI